MGRSAIGGMLGVGRLLRVTGSFASAALLEYLTCRTVLECCIILFNGIKSGTTGLNFLGPSVLNGNSF